MSESEVEKLCEQGRLHIRTKEISAAVTAYQQAVALDPDCCDAHEGLATCAYMSNDYPEAIKHYTKLTLLKPIESRFYTNLGAIHNRMGEHMKACDYLRKAIQRNKRCAESFYNLGIAQRKLKQNSMAVSAYKEAIKINPMMAEAYQNLANVYVDMGNLQMAVANFKKALEIKPDFEKARAGLEKAEDHLNAAKLQNNVMGRLATMKSTVSVVTSLSSRELREDERVEDRKFIKQAGEDIEHTAKDCVAHLRTKLIPAVMEVERAMAHTHAGRTHSAHELVELDEAATALREATAQWAALRTTLKNHLAELRAHEEAIGK